LHLCRLVFFAYNRQDNVLWARSISSKYLRCLNFNI
jgi:hypothetical protein